MADPDRTTTLLTRRLALHFEGDQALTHVDTEALRREIARTYTLLSDRPVAVSVQDDHLYVTFLVQAKQERPAIGFR